MAVQNNIHSLYILSSYRLECSTFSNKQSLSYQNNNSLCLCCHIENIISNVLWCENNSIGSNIILV